MDEKFKSLLEENGVDVKNTIKRFMGKEEMYQKFLGKFMSDQNYDNLGKNLEEKNYEEAYKCAHTLKGVTANLGLDPIQSVVSDLVEELRGKKAEEVDEMKVNAKWQDVKSTYERFYEIISQNQ